ncbi:hypothetical protein Sru01_33790 [Sphaerisporangium rufum]|uniref:histidine kinase n=1 Tax=Sphaerisporangium rufum TaxID=1381558 RepID=A0A919R753_9ACTN|nr:HAMP domain-containing sensor histidine kinase [Sphaerisporangium rufum]GII78397.1 hypothetical protein Sru01_33790 [Sphaerisporangium rufum]
MRLSSRFAVYFAGAFPALVLAAGLLMLTLVSADLRAERDDHLATRLRALAPTAAAYAWRSTRLPQVPPEYLQRWLAAAAAQAADAGGVYLDIPGAAPLVVGDVPPARPPARAAGPAGFTAGGREWRYAATGLGLHGDTATLWVFEPGEHLDARLRTLGRRVALATLVAVAVGAAAGAALGRFATRPLAALRRQARAIGTPPESGARLGTASGVTELDELALLLNHLLDRRDAAVARTGEALETARAFAATAAHELRTPLTSMRTNITLLEHPGLPPGERAEVMRDLVAEQARVERLVTMLRRLAAGELLDPAGFAATDVAEIAASAAADARRRHPGARIAVTGASTAVVRGWAEGLRLIVDNLLDNAAVHGAGPAGHAEITVTVTVTGTAAGTATGGTGGTVMLEVADRGRGILPADREAVFARFHRHAGSPGSGLGLTLVRQQARLHGGDAAVAGGPAGAGTRVQVRIPLTGPSAPPAAPGGWLG